MKNKIKYEIGIANELMVKIGEALANQKYYTTHKLTGDSVMKQVIIRESEGGNEIVVDDKVISSFDRDTSQDDAVDAVISLCLALGVELRYDGEDDEDDEDEE